MQVLQKNNVNTFTASLKSNKHKNLIKSGKHNQTLTWVCTLQVTKTTKPSFQHQSMFITCLVVLMYSHQQWLSSTRQFVPRHATVTQPGQETQDNSKLRFPLITFKSVPKRAAKTVIPRYGGKAIPMLQKNKINQRAGSVSSQTALKSRENENTQLLFELTRVFAELWGCSTKAVTVSITAGPTVPTPHSPLPTPAAAHTPSWRLTVAPAWIQCVNNQPS